MTPEPLPPDLRDLEGRRERRPRPEPAADLRARVLAAAAAARADPAPDRVGRRWRQVWQTAAVATLALNLGMTVANGVRFHRLTAPAATPGPAVPDASDATDRLPPYAAS